MIATFIPEQLLFWSKNGGKGIIYPKWTFVMGQIRVWSEEIKTQNGKHNKWNSYNNIRDILCE